jgi:hypothetical protein
MIANPKRLRRRPVNDPGDRERTEEPQERALDDALANTFPASDPVSIEQPASRQASTKKSDIDTTD